MFEIVEDRPGKGRAFEWQELKGLVPPLQLLGFTLARDMSCKPFQFLLFKGLVPSLAASVLAGYVRALSTAPM